MTEASSGRRVVTCGQAERVCLLHVADLKSAPSVANVIREVQRATY